MDITLDKLLEGEESNGQLREELLAWEVMPVSDLKAACLAVIRDNLRLAMAYQKTKHGGTSLTHVIGETMRWLKLAAKSDDWKLEWIVVSCQLHDEIRAVRELLERERHAN